MKIDVIIPTILNVAPEVFAWSLMELRACESVNRIIVIDNTEAQQFSTTFPHIIAACPSIEVVNGFEKGFLVNDAWNFGVELSKSTIVQAPLWCLINDDVMISKEIMNLAAKHFNTQQKLTLVTIETKNGVTIEKYEEDCRNIQRARFEAAKERQGWIMIGRKHQWVQIPKELRLFYGDDWIYKRSREIGNIAILKGAYCSHFQSSSVNKNINRLKPIMNEDAKIWAEKYHNWKRK